MDGQNLIFQTLLLPELGVRDWFPTMPVISRPRSKSEIGLKVQIFGLAIQERAVYKIICLDYDDVYKESYLGLQWSVLSRKKHYTRDWQSFNRNWIASQSWMLAFWLLQNRAHDSFFALLFCVTKFWKKTSDVLKARNFVPNWESNVWNCQKLELAPKILILLYTETAVCLFLNNKVARKCSKLNFLE